MVCRPDRANGVSGSSDNSPQGLPHEPMASGMTDPEIEEEKTKRERGAGREETDISVSRRPKVLLSQGRIVSITAPALWAMGDGDPQYWQPFSALRRLQLHGFSLQETFTTSLLSWH